MTSFIPTTLTSDNILQDIPVLKTRDPTSLQSFVKTYGDLFETLTPHEIFTWAASTFGERMAITSSMSDGVVAHLASRVIPGIKVIFLDTGYHFSETLAVREEVSKAIPIRLISIEPVQSVSEQDAAFGGSLYATDPGLCCRLRKVEPLETVLHDVDAWITGLRRSDSEERGKTRILEWDKKRQKVKINPIASWNDEKIEDYIKLHKIPVNELLSQGYGSVGCAPCTVRGLGRTGRWTGIEKTECGLHQ